MNFALKRLRRDVAWGLFLLVFFGPAFGGTADRAEVSPLVQGIVWQPDNATINPIGQWQRLGARQLLVQWTAVDNLAFIPGTDLYTLPVLPDWNRIAAEPWAQEVIVGLAGRFDENLARNDLPKLVDTSIQLALLPIPVKVVGWYFPVEIDPTWSQVTLLAKQLDRLPRPLWISVYDSANWGAETLADSLSQWLPPDVGVFFQDGVGVHARTAKVALHYADVLVARFGKHRVKLIAEAFRPQVGGGFRSASAEELLPQLAMYKGHSIYLFDGPHYVPDTLIDQLVQGKSAAGK
jgi:hypothetical protein